MTSWLEALKLYGVQYTTASVLQGRSLEPHFGVIIISILFVYKKHVHRNTSVTKTREQDNKALSVVAPSGERLRGKGRHGVFAV